MLLAPTPHGASRSVQAMPASLGENPTYYGLFHPGLLRLLGLDPTLVGVITPTLSCWWGYDKGLSPTPCCWGSS